jgi:CelD/BcsL family acetyltransferase involved in cellulose biosynthesis
MKGVRRQRTRPDGVSEIRLSVHGEMAALETQWRAFEARADRTVFQSYDWLAKWQRHIGAGKRVAPAIVSGRDAAGELLFIFPFGIERHGPIRCLTWLASGLCDYNAPLLAEHFPAHCDAMRFRSLWRDVVALLRTQSRYRFDVVDLQKMPERIGGQPNPFLNLPVLANPSHAYVANLGTDWDTFFASKRSASTRKRERRQFKHLAEHGEVRFVDVEDRSDVERTLAGLIGQKTRALARMGAENMFARPGYPEFYRDVATDPSLRDVIHVGRLDVGSEIGAANLGLQFRGCYYLVLSSYSDGVFNRFGPGRAHLQELLQRAIAKGFRALDFTIGDEPYKRDWADEIVVLYDHLAAATVTGGIAAPAMTARRRLKRFIKQTPAVWEMFRKLRAWKGTFARKDAEK